MRVFNYVARRESRDGVAFYHPNKFGVQGIVTGLPSDVHIGDLLLFRDAHGNAVVSYQICDISRFISTPDVVSASVVFHARDYRAIEQDHRHLENGDMDWER